MSGALAIAARDGAARAGTVTTAHGAFTTPAFMPVGTHATVKSLDPTEVRACGAEILLCNGYHLMLRPGVELVERAGGLHRFMGWDGPILTDSGGYQLVSLEDRAVVEDDGAVFVSPYDGTRLRVRPEDAVAAQSRLGSDIIMCLDHPVAYGASAARTEEATARTHRWAERCRAAHPAPGRQLLFGIAQGGFDPQLRAASARLVAGLDFDGMAIGGLALGEPVAVMAAMAEVSVAELPERLPRYVMGLGTDNELLTMVGLGIDMFDCVVPTRLARNAVALTRAGRLSLKQAAWRDDLRPVEEGCPCSCCRRFSRAYLRHLFGAGEILAHRLVSIHNLTHLAQLMAEAREAIVMGRFADHRAEVAERLARGQRDDAGARGVSADPGAAAPAEAGTPVTRAAPAAPVGADRPRP
ncbi:MAG: tRNA guanosine(34) transglycosylase Tgt [Candidatus Dormibacteria bacterium]